uniref:Glutamine-dependent NAD(+) synthetase n=1 Tax=Phallusia mammillata TaxID=59560 RepID=A0A6F9DMH1_9ASCI|nr:glutamine-dependent NAD(+) synthetase [Phallusia mammillata]
MGSKIKLAVSCLNQWALDFQGNLERITEAIKQAHELGATYCLTPEISVSGYGCDDHFLEIDTERHCWEVLEELLQLEECKQMICDVGMPVVHRGSRFNCRIIFLFKRILLIRPKTACCNELNYRELRWFVPWQKSKTVESYLLPQNICYVTGQSHVEIGDGIIETGDACIGSEICEELWTAENSHVSLGLDGVDIFTNGSGSQFSLQQLHRRMDLIKATTRKMGGAYLMCNQVGCDGGRIFYDGCSMIACNGDIVACTPQFSLKEVEVEVATVDLEDIRSFRVSKPSRSMQATKESEYPRIKIHGFFMCPDGLISQHDLSCTLPIQITYKTSEEEIEFSASNWLWDYLRRSGQSGFFLPLSGGVDSSSVACIVFAMCNLVCKAVHDGNKGVLSDVRRLVHDQSYAITSPENLCNDIFTTCYMASENSSVATKQRASSLAKRIGSNHLELRIDTVVSALLMVFTAVTGFIPKFTAKGGSRRENLALQNNQARIRMVLAYLFAQLMQWVRGKPGGLLVLGSSNIDEALRGYYTKYDCSSADINPIGGIGKTELKSFVSYFCKKYNVQPLREIVEAPPTAELEPLEDGEITQTDEVQMGMTYNELSVFGKLRKVALCGPYGMFTKLVQLWKQTYSPRQVAEKVKHFFYTYSINRHKMTTLTPAMHCDAHSPEDSRHDLRPFLYHNKWTWQFRKIDDHVAKLEEHEIVTKKK